MKNILIWKLLSALPDDWLRTTFWKALL